MFKTLATATILLALAAPTVSVGIADAQPMTRSQMMMMKRQRMMMMERKRHMMMVRKHRMMMMRQRSM